MPDNADPGSFRDPGGYVFYRGDDVYRTVSKSGRDHYDLLKSSGFYDIAVRQGLLISHTEVDDVPGIEGAYKVLKPEKIHFISYPYEWSFSQLRDAAILTIRLQRQAIENGLSMKDASAYNVQFVNGSPLFIDTLSFEPYKEGSPWVAYQQFCRHFLGPLALMAYVHIDLAKLLRANIDGLNMALVSQMLPAKTRLKFSLLTHIHLHARTEIKLAGQPALVRNSQRGTFSRNSMLGLIDNLEAAVRNLQWTPAGTEWGDYYIDTNYSDEALAAKKRIVEKLLVSVQPRDVWDLGANTGLFSRVASDRQIRTVAFDIDPAAVEKNYREVRKKKELFILPLVMNLTNPSPGLGWDHSERKSLLARGPVDLVMALALVHHFAIGNNVPLLKVAESLSKLGRQLIVEFIPKSDSQVKRLLATREDIFHEYHETSFEAAFSGYFEFIDKIPIQDSERTIYLMRRKISP